jgi:hypothetical protein
MQGVSLLVARSHMALALRPREVHQLKLRNDDIIWVLAVNLGESKTQNAVGPAARIIDPVRCHHFVFKPLPKIFETVLYGMAFKLINVFNIDIIIMSHFYFKARDPINYSLAILYFVTI